MPEGPSRVILREDTEAFVGRKILRVSGNSKQDIARLDQQKVLALRSWGKRFFLIERAHFSARIHFLLFGSYRINEDKPNAVPRLCLEFSKGQRLHFYACSVQFMERPLDEVYDWTADVMNPLWDAAQARRKLRAAPCLLAADALLDQTIFAGVGNIIKNEVLHSIHVHPESTVGALPARKLGQLVPQARDYSFDFSTWKKACVLKTHYQMHTKTSCPRDRAPLQCRKHLGKAGRRAFFCEVCQRLYRADGA
ncbi:endonuclease [Xanthomonas prunicola]|uniref:endonuclease n=1 Tax=Xanthomonas prunicola TaxID=2053930 RepID=UPI0021B35CE9|nr:endonuclease [Xanthomonas prunicola]UXA51853.1 endonuclease [Xanthomonas prunicola]